MVPVPEEGRKQGFRYVFLLAAVTIVYNLAEGLVATFFGYTDETLTLFGFGADSFIETISALGVAQMVVRIRKNPESDKGKFEVAALRITGWCFYALSGILIASAAYSVVQGHQPVSTIPGVIIGLVSICLMWALVSAKLRLGKKLDSQPVISDARCNVVCIYMSVVLLAASALWWLFHIPYTDALGSLALVYFCVNEGREAFEKARGIHNCCC
jgi:divalent metal cation (Fe/Co/Zn/Cd) transporter